ncbi:MULTISPECIES: lipopolysaccharide assembly protein LapB [unclassified Arenimonas]|uniref:lipopolysaccharide assembly protein LapB n=1 Tax=unclassified Arenimonas TaxID=2641713 RepID=UPI00086C7F05|nr:MULTISPECIES: lipopolysaccharide assembly protein LapB [unclassified Arenimonas]ODS62293.1 MAG: lipopolysaccharide assembly protein LapB [Arenimonas sp. SCN 70-307]
MTELAWLLLLLPVAAGAGWLAGRRGGERRGGARVSRLSNTYFRGLNYLLNEQQDKAIEVFLQIAAVDKDTVETQFALGHLFRRRGEVDRAIRLHQDLVARPGLSDEQKTRAVLALGEDYMRAGLLDRAETLFTDLVRMGVLAPQALRHLISIYQAERDWAKAIEHARKLEGAGGEPMGKLVAQFHCELAEIARLGGDVDAARRHVAEAYAADSHSVRAGLVEARLELGAGNDAAAIRAFERVARHDIEFLPEILDPLLACYERRGESARARGFLLEMIEHYPGVSPVLALTRIIEREEGKAPALEFLSTQLRQRPSVRGEAAYIDLSLRDQGTDPARALRTLKQITEQLVVRTPGYRCQRCGFGARAHHWQCPGCKSWGSIKPVHGAVSE